MADKEREAKLIAEMEAKRKHYQDCFSGESGEYVLDDLKKSCYAEYTTFSKDALEMAYREGIRTAYLYIKRQLEKPLTKPTEA